MTRMGRKSPNRFINGHNARGETHPTWNGGRNVTPEGYVRIRILGHGYVFEHVMVAEAALGKVLPTNAVLHHVNEHRSDNRGANLVLCQDRAYHNLLHRRMRARAACGHADWRPCKFCREYDDPSRLFITSRSGCHHRECHNRHKRGNYVPHPIKTKLDASSVSEIRRRFSAGGITQTALAEEFGVTQSSISLLLHHHTWKGGASCEA